MNERVKMRNIQRMWVNCPSVLQSDHKLHGTRVLADLDDNTFEKSVSCFFVDGETHSAFIDRMSLSKGWPTGCS